MKSIACLSISPDVWEIAKMKIPNISQYVEGILTAEIDIKNEEESETSKQLIDKLRSRIGYISFELNKVRKENLKLKKELIELKTKKEKKNDGNREEGGEFSPLNQLTPFN